MKIDVKCGALTDSYWIFNILHFHNIPEQDTSFFVAFPVIKFVVVKYDARGIYDSQTSFELNGLQFLCMAGLCSNGTDLKFKERV